MKKLILLFGLILITCPVRAQQTGAALLRRLGYPPDSKLLIIHADDVGMSHSVDMASFKALENGWVSSASIMVPCPWFEETAEFARTHPDLDFGLHLTLTSEWRNYRWGPVNRGATSTLLDSQGYFPRDSSAVGKSDSPAQVAAELHAQVEKARAAGIHFSHLDNHMGAVSQNARLYAVYLRTARNAGVPSFVSTGEIKAYGRLFANYKNLPAPIYIGPAPASNPMDGWKQTLSTLAPGVYITIVHLGYDNPELEAIMLKDAGGAAERQAAFNLVSSPQFRQMLQDNKVKLVSWRDVAKALPAPASR